jgi:protease I
MPTLNGKRIAILVANEGVEEVELTSPRDALKDAGAVVELLAPSAEPVQAFNHLDKADTFEVDRTVSDSSPEEYDAVVLPGGVANPDQLRTDPGSLEFMKSFANTQKPIGVICHGPWTLISAGLLQGRQVTSWPSLRVDITNAGGQWVDQEVVVDGRLISSRKPDDLPAFNAALIDQIAGDIAG